MGILSNTDSVRSRIERGLHQRGFECKYGHYYYGDYRFQMREMSVAFGVKIKGGRGYHKKGWWYYGKLNVENLLELADKVVERVKADRAKAVAEHPATQGVGVEVNENEDKDGVEIRFAEKPDQSVIDQVKAHGFRWSKFQKLWYAKQSPETLEFAYGLIGKKPENLDGPDMGTVLESEPAEEQPKAEGGIDYADRSNDALALTGEPAFVPGPDEEEDGDDTPEADESGQFKLAGAINNPEYVAGQA